MTAAVTRDDRDFITIRYDDILSAAEGDMTLAEVREHLQSDVVAYLATRDRDLEAEARVMIDRALTRTRDKRAQSLRRDLAWIIDWLANPSEGAVGVEALMGQAYRLGTEDGRDKTLRYWTAGDLAASVTSRYREASDAMRAAREFDDTVTALTSTMAAHGAARVGDLLDPVTGYAA